MNHQNTFSSHLLVLLQFAGIVLSLFPWGLPILGTPIFLSLSLAGLVLIIATLRHNRFGNFQVYPELKNNIRLITSGPYRLIRHPMYTSLILALAGGALSLGHPFNYAGLALVCFSVYGKAKKEERYLTERFPEYRNYTLQTKKFIPFIF